MAQIQPAASPPSKQSWQETFRVASAARSVGRFIGELAPDGIPATLAAGLAALILIVVESLSYAALIFSGPLSPYVNIGIGITLTTAVVIGVMTAAFGSYSGTIAFSQSKVAALMAVMAATLVSAAGASVPAEQAALTVAAAIFVSTIITGGALAGLGVFKLGALVRFIPYPVICGFLASVGWLLCLGAFKTLTGFALTPTSLPALVQLGVMAHWAPGAAFGIAALVLMHRIKHYMVMPLLILAAVCCFYLTLLWSGMSLAEARHAGWLIHTGSTGNLFHNVTFKAATEADFGLIAMHAGTVATIIIVSAVALLLNSSALELAAGRDIDLNRELKVFGIGNVLSGLCGGMVGFSSVNISKFVLSIGVRGRLVGLIGALGCAVILAGGAKVTEFVPVLLIGGLLLYIGLGFLHEWLYRPAREFHVGDLSIVVIILAIVSLVGLIEGIIAGIVSAIIIFTVKYSSLDGVKLDTSIAAFRSTMQRPDAQVALLEQRGDRAQIFQLRDFVFFGSADRLLMRVRARMLGDRHAGNRYIILDFRLVTGIDLSAIISFMRLGQLAQAAGVTIVLTQLPTPVLAQMKRGGLFAKNEAVWKLFPSLDLGVEWCEDRLLGEEGKPAEGPVPLPRFLQDKGFSAEDAAEFSTYVSRSRYVTGEKLIRQGEVSDALCFVEDGVVAVQLNFDNGSRFRVAKLAAGSFVGEIGFYLQTLRTADVIVEEDATICSLSRSSADSLRRTAPKLAAHFQEVLIHILANRLVLTDKLLKTLLH